MSFGLTLHTNSRHCVANVTHIIESLTQKQKKRFILRLTKGAQWMVNEYSDYALDELAYKQVSSVKMNTAYKWSIYTIFKLISKHQIRCHLSSHNLYDIAWTLILRAQLNIESCIYYDTDIYKFTNLSKLLHVITHSSIHTESVFVYDASKSDVMYVLRKLLNQSNKYHSIYKYQQSLNQVFLKSHALFFKWLQYNYSNVYFEQISASNQVTSHHQYPAFKTCRIESDESMPDSIKTQTSTSLSLHNPDLDIISKSNDATHSFDIGCYYSLNTSQVLNWLNQYKSIVSLINITDEYYLTKLLNACYKMKQQIIIDLNNWKSNPMHIINWDHYTLNHEYTYFRFKLLLPDNGHAISSSFIRDHSHNFLNIYQSSTNNKYSDLSDHTTIIDYLISNITPQFIAIDYSIGGRYSDDIFNLIDVIEQTK